MKEPDERLRQFDALWQDPAIRNRAFYPDFRRGWEALLRRAVQSEELYFELGGENVLEVPCSFAGTDFVFHFDQLKMAKKAVAEAAKGNKEEFENGDEVRHAKFGEGIVLDTDGKTITVMFSEYGTKKLVAELAPIKKIKKK